MALGKFWFCYWTWFIPENISIPATGYTKYYCYYGYSKDIKLNTDDVYCEFWTFTLILSKRSKLLFSVYIFIVGWIFCYSPLEFSELKSKRPTFWSTFILLLVLIWNPSNRSTIFVSLVFTSYSEHPKSIKSIYYIEVDCYF